MFKVLRFPAKHIGIDLREPITSGTTTTNTFSVSLSSNQYISQQLLASTSLPCGGELFYETLMGFYYPNQSASGS